MRKNLGILRRVIKSHGIAVHQIRHRRRHVRGVAGIVQNHRKIYWLCCGCRLVHGTECSSLLGSKLLITKHIRVSLWLRIVLDIYYPIS